MKTKAITFVIVAFLMMGGMAYGASSSTTTTGTSDAQIILISLINQDPDPAIAGDVAELRLGVENFGGKAINDLMLEIDPVYPTELAAGEDAVKSVGTLKAYQTGGDMRIVKYRIRISPDVKAGTYTIPVRYYEEGSSTYSEKDITVSVKSKQSADIINIDQTDMIPGRKTTMKFLIKNVGSATLRNIVFSWVNSDNIILPVGGDNTKYIKSLDIGESVEVEYDAIADTNVDPGLYQLTLSLKYDDETTGTETETSTIAGIYVGGSTDFEVAYTGESDGEMSFTVANTGSNTAYSVTVKIPEQEGYRATGSNTEIIGNLNNGDYTVVSFTVSKLARATEGLEMNIIYTDTKGERLTVRKTVDLGSTSTAQFPAFNATSGQTFTRTGNRGGMGGMERGFSNIITMAITGLKAAAVIVAVGLVYWYYRHRKKKKDKVK